MRLDRNEDPEGWNQELFATFKESLKASDFGFYPDSSSLVSVLASQLGVSQESLLICNGSTEGLRLIFETYCSPGSSVLLMEPSYSLYELYSSVEASTVCTTEYKLDLDASDVWTNFVDAAQNLSRGLCILANPDQPSGAVRSFEQITTLAEACLSSDSLLVIDEAYHMFGAPAAHSLLRTHPNVVLVRTFSKAYGMAGARVGFVASSEEVISDLKRLELAVPPSGLSLRLALFAANRARYFQLRALDIVAGREFLRSRFVECGIQSLPSGGNFVLILTGTEDKAMHVVSEVRNLGYAIKGPLVYPQFGPCIRVTIGSRQLMRQFWSDTGDVLVTSLGASSL